VHSAADVAAWLNSLTRMPSVGPAPAKEAKR
jgi:hypothetical protein